MVFSATLASNVLRSVKNGKVWLLPKVMDILVGHIRPSPLTLMKIELSLVRIFLLEKFLSGHGQMDGSSGDEEPVSWGGNPHSFELLEDNQSSILSTEPTVTAELAIVDLEGKPVPDIVVGCNPNIVL